MSYDLANPVVNRRLRNYMHYLHNPVEEENSNLTSYECGEDIVSHVPVVVIAGKAYKMNNTVSFHQFAFVGFSKSSGNLLQPVVIEKESIKLDGWGLIPNQHYMAGADGSLVITNEVSGSFSKIVGFAIDANTLLIIKDFSPINIL